VEEKFIEENGELKPDADYLAARGFSQERATYLHRLAQQAVSLETVVGEDGDSALGDFVEDERTSDEGSPSELAGNAELREKLLELINSLGQKTGSSQRTAMIMRLRFGFEDGKFWTLEEIGNEMGITRERVRQIIEKTLRRLRRRIQTDFPERFAAFLKKRRDG